VQSKSKLVSLIAAVAADFEPSQVTLKSWCEECLQPYEMRGRPERAALVGMDLLLMCLYLTAYPTASGDEIAIHIINNGGGVYECPIISKHMAEMKLTKKQGSTEAYQAFLPHNILRLRRFWIMPPPVGVFGQARKKLIDTNECGISLEKTNKGIGHAHTTI
jgi:hypothetical protein